MSKTVVMYAFVARNSGENVRAWRERTADMPSFFYLCEPCTERLRAEPHGYWIELNPIYGDPRGDDGMQVHGESAVPFGTACAICLHSITRRRPQCQANLDAEEAYELSFFRGLRAGD